MIKIPEGKSLVCHLGVELDDKSYSRKSDVDFRNEYQLNGYKIIVNASKQHEE